jgi:hypothetical protein
MSKGQIMNERIEKFARECGAWNQVYGNRNFMLDEHFDIEKFAELIVRECADIATMNQHQWASAGSYVLEHFGVKL